jgi:hypothetical protein
VLWLRVAAGPERVTFWLNRNSSFAKSEMTASIVPDTQPHPPEPDEAMIKPEKRQMCELRLSRPKVHPA